MNHKIIIRIPTDEELDEDLRTVRSKIAELNREAEFLEKMKQLNGAGRLAMQLKLEELLWDQEHPNEKIKIQQGDTIQIRVRMEKLHE